MLLVKMIYQLGMLLFLEYKLDQNIHHGKSVHLKLRFSEEYPNKLPKARFLTKMFHPNCILIVYFRVYNDGQIKKQMESMSCNHYNILTCNFITWR